ncbi:MAG: ABC transporter permease [Acidobacteriaceae bacterium]|jgi:ABC-2 type transport system permease protein
MPSRMILRNTMLVAKREYLERVRSKVFRFTTVLVPVGLGAIGFLAGMGGKRLDQGVRQLAIVSNQTRLALDVQSVLKQSDHPPQSIEIFAPGTAADVTQLNQAVEQHRIGGYLILNRDPGQSRPQATWVSGSATDFVGQDVMKGAVTDALVREQLTSRGMTDSQIKELMKSVKLNTMQVKNGGTVTSNAGRSFAGAYVLILVLYGAVLIYGINIARSVVEEKTTRIFEVLLATASSDSLMLGKLLGVGAVGLTQMAVWGGVAMLYAGSSLAAAAKIHGLASLGLTRPEMIFFPVFFLLGFFFYSAMAAALGSAVSGEQDVQQFIFILAAPLIVSVVMMVYVMTNPSSAVSVIMSLIPPFTPIVMYMRICSQVPPWWQIALGIALLAGSVWAMIWLAARIYRIGVLMYGKRPTLPEIMRWLRYS